MQTILLFGYIFSLPRGITENEYGGRKDMLLGYSAAVGEGGGASGNAKHASKLPRKLITETTMKVTQHATPSLCKSTQLRS